MTRFIAAALLAGTAMATPAGAAPLFFDFVADNSLGSVSFALDTNPSPLLQLNESYVTFKPLPVKTSSGTYNANIFFYTPFSAGGFDIFNSATNASIARVTGAQLFSGTNQAPIFSMGSYKLNGLLPFSGGTLTISAVNSAVPEPATWAMMILGMGAVGYAMRRRQKVTAKVRFA
jgi:hypothetical protein